MSRGISVRFYFWAWIAVETCFGMTALAAAKKPLPPAPPLDGKRVIALLPIEKTEVELPDGEIHDFGQEFGARFITQLTQSGKFIVTDAPLAGIGSEVLALRAAKEAPPPEFQWSGTSLPVATIGIQVDNLSFQTGLRGTKMLYGFQERFASRMPNEFPLTESAETSRPARWFGASFDAKGDSPFDSRSGLDLGEGFEINFLFAWLNVKYAHYQSDAHLRLTIEAPWQGVHQVRRIKVKGEGFFFDVSAGYEGYTGGLMAARRDAMTQAIRNALNASMQALAEELGKLTFVARLDATLSDGTLLVGTGHDAQLRTGLLFQSTEDEELIFRIERSVHEGSIARVVRGELVRFRSGSIFKQVNEIPPLRRLGGAVVGLSSALMASAAAAPSVVDQSLALPWASLPKADLSPWLEEESTLAAFFRSVVEFVFLPYRIWRYFQYDQAYHAQSDLPDSSEAETMGQWFELARREAWASRIGLAQVNPQSPTDGVPPVVAIIDTGIDYNHPVLHESLWLNDAATTDGFGFKDRYGWDFISGDFRAYDDHYHGTQLASAVAAIAPFVRLMPLKVFNPWGITNSNSIHSAFHYAVDHGARIILCGWSTRKRSQAIEAGVQYANDHGVVVVAAAGDQGANLGVQPEYPAALAAEYPNVLSVAAVDGRDRLLSDGQIRSNYGFGWVKMAAPGRQVRVLEPRGNESRASSTGIAAAIVAGAAARAYIDGDAPASLILRLQQSADSVTELWPWVQGGYRLRVDR